MPGPRPAILTITLACFGFALAGCDGSAPTATDQGPPAPSGARYTRPSEQGLYEVDLWPEGGSAPLNRIHAWRMRARNAAGEVVVPTRVTVNGGMPQHGHGLVTHPRARRPTPDGEVRIEGLRFHMTGRWTLRVEVYAEGQADLAIFEIEVEP